MENNKIDISGINSNFLNVEFGDLKTDFLKIQNYYIGRPLTNAMVEELNYKYKNLFNHFGLNDLQWRLTKGEYEIIFTPIRKIDEYAIFGILNSCVTIKI